MPRTSASAAIGVTTENAITVLCRCPPLTTTTYQVRKDTLNCIGFKIMTTGRPARRWDAEPLAGARRLAALTAFPCGGAHLARNLKYPGHADLFSGGRRLRRISSRDRALIAGARREHRRREALVNQGKLVRDNIPQIIRAKGLEPVTLHRRRGGIRHPAAGQAPRGGRGVPRLRQRDHASRSPLASARQRPRSRAVLTGTRRVRQRRTRTGRRADVGGRRPR
jgi:hypothetical protein